MNAILDRPLRSLAKSRFIRSCASLKLAMLLLSLLILACVIGTVAESRLDTAVAQAYVYDAPWFILWLFVLCANLTCSVLVRYPWKRQQAGFIVTHAGIVILLGGGMIGRIWGIEGNVTLYKGDQPQSSMLVNQTVLQLQTENMAVPAAFPISLRLRPPTPDRPLRWSLQGHSISVLEYSERLAAQTVVEEGDVTGAPAVQLRLTSSMAHAPVDTWLVLDDPQRRRLALGPLTLNFLRDQDPGQIQPETESQAASPASDGSSPAAVREKYFAFAKFPNMGVTRSITGQPTGIKATFRFDSAAVAPAEAKGVLDLAVADKTFSFPVANILGRETALTGTPWTIEGLQFLPEFRMQGKEAVSASETPKNPAVVFEVVGLSSKTTVPAGANSDASHEGCSHDDHACSAEHMKEDKSCCDKPAAHAAAAKPAAAPTGLSLFYRPDGSLQFASSFKGKASERATVQLGKEMPAGFGDWKLVVQRFVPHSRLRQELAPAPAGTPEANLTSGISVQIQPAGQSVQRWLATGTPAHLHFGSEHFLASFGYRVQPLGFEVALEKFEVERNEGTQTPAGFKSHVRFTDPASRTTVQREVWMNHPATFPEFFGAGFLGTSYKFSQASWNPNDLNQTTLQVLRDPGWSLKWVGSLLLCVGLFMMFYLKPRRLEPARL